MMWRKLKAEIQMLRYAVDDAQARTQRYHARSERDWRDLVEARQLVAVLQAKVDALTAENEKLKDARAVWLDAANAVGLALRDRK